MVYCLIVITLKSLGTMVIHKGGYMPSCERCWGRAYTKSRTTGREQVDIYRELIKTEKCTPEQQAGDGAGKCPKCCRHSVHVYTKQCMNPECV
jgi:hypothetical protein